MARKTTDELVTIIRMEVDKAVADLKKVGKAQNRFSEGGKKGFVGLKLAAIGYTAALAALALTAKKVITLSAEQEKVEKRLSFAVKAAGIETGRTTQQLVEFAGALQKATGFGDEAIIPVQTLLIQLGRLEGEGLKRATKATLDFSVAMGIDLQSAGILVAKAATGFTSALSRYGIIVDENIPKSEQFAAALTQIEEKFGGTAQSDLETFSGRMRAFTSTLGDLGEVVGDIVLPVLTEYIKTLTVIIDKVGRVIDLLKTPVPDGTFADLLGVGGEMPETRILDFGALERATFEPRPLVTPGPGPGDGAAAVTEITPEQIIQQMAGEEALRTAITEGRIQMQTEELERVAIHDAAMLEQQAGHIQHLADLDMERTETERFMSEMRVQFAEDEEAKKAMFREQSIAGIKMTLGNLAAAFPKQKEFAIVNSLISTYQGASQALKDVPFPANIAAAASVLAVGLKQVRAIKSASPSGGGPQGFNVSTGANLPVLSQPTSPNVTVIIKGGGLESLIEDINIQVEDNNVRLVSSESFTSIEADSLR